MPFDDDLVDGALDACVLFPVGLSDTLLSIAEAALYLVLWSAEILDETRRNILDDLPDLDPEQLERTFAAMHHAFPDALAAGHETLTATMTNHPKDRHVLAAAVAGGAQVLVTSNRRDFPPAACEPFAIDVQHPDEFLDYALELDPETVITTLAYQASIRWTRRC